ncbi:MAG: ATP-binding protein [Candidatus Margulisbacteria bacterium]|jgi:predicted AAA+ superfamily ATPase|nr:ATP-binding protein [Candidatus Margulisiibacteriota bacterium]
MLRRAEYLKRLLGFKDKQLIKIVTGVRRCGKSTLFELYQAELLKSGVRPEQIQSLNLEDMDNEALKNYRVLYAHVKKRLVPGRMNYIFLDEIQNVPDFEKAADGLFIKKNVDLYLTGSNSKIQSGEWATLLSGRYVEIHLFPLSFKEYAAAFTAESRADNFQRYLADSSFPYTLQLCGDQKQIRDYLGGIYNTIVLKDVVENKKIRNISRLESVIKFMADNIGNLTSIKKISDTMASDGLKVLPLTVESYLDALRDSYILYRAGRYDVKGRKLLQTLDKYYLVDMGLRHYLLGRQRSDSGRELENIVYLELLRRGYRVYIGKVGDKEVDFVAESLRGVEYYQVADTVRGETALRRELSALAVIRDHNPKFLLTRDFDPPVSHNGIKQLNVLDWLGEKY